VIFAARVVSVPQKKPVVALLLDLSANRYWVLQVALASLYHGHQYFVVGEYPSLVSTYLHVIETLLG